MSLNASPSAERIHIAFFGCGNAGKSSLVNKLTGQDLAVVSSLKGTTTDPVKKSMELLPLGPVLIIDTPGYDDKGSLGEMRVAKTREVLRTTDIAVLVIDACKGVSEHDKELIKIFKASNIDYLIVFNKIDLLSGCLSSAVIDGSEIGESERESIVKVSSLTGSGIEELKIKLAGMQPDKDDEKRLIGDLIAEDDLIILVVPIDEASPKGRLILPQQMTIRDILDKRAKALVVREGQVAESIKDLGKAPAMIVCDSRVFAEVAAESPEEIPLTSFSILMARYKGFLETAVKGVLSLDSLQDGDKILISEGCTHHRQCNDIGTVKLPALLKKYSGKDIIIETSSGKDFRRDLSDFSLVIHCGGCMLPERELILRMQEAVAQAVPFTNYGVAIAYMRGILKRSIKIFPDLYALVDKH